LVKYGRDRASNIERTMLEQTDGCNGSSYTTSQCVGGGPIPTVKENKLAIHNGRRPYKIEAALPDV